MPLHFQGWLLRPEDIEDYKDTLIDTVATVFPTWFLLLLLLDLSSQDSREPDMEVLQQNG